ncbi:DUF2158 domain-containing protein [Acinetobacter guillouiae]|uniref:DUF2158 domain-containing protein n=1 Tax=Acinetobacter TaxID=469 RepID=UPI003AF759B3
MSNLKEGDIVELKSGSPYMTIVELHSNGSTAVVSWFCYDDHDIKTKVIELIALTKNSNS